MRRPPPPIPFLAALTSTVQILTLCCAWNSVLIAGQVQKGEDKRPDQMADLVARSLSVEPAFPMPGEQTEITLVVEDRGGGPAQQAEVTFFLDGRPLATRQININTHSVQTITVPWVPKDIGLHALSATVDTQRVITELDPFDNSTSVEVVVANRPPDASHLTVTHTTVSSDDAHPNILRVTVSNSGSVPASAPLLLQQGQTRRILFVGPVAPKQSLTIELPWGGDRNSLITSVVNPRFRPNDPEPGSVTPHQFG
jgi:hypothetical protein